jgi:hypothetical protein
MGTLESETRMVIGRLIEPTDPARAWWWESTTTIHGAELTVAGYAASESDAILEAAASTLDLHEAYATAREATEPAEPLSTGRSPEAIFWGRNGSDEHGVPGPAAEPSADGPPDEATLRS